MSNSHLQFSESPAWMASPTNIDNNYYGSPVASPGSWNVASPNSSASSVPPNTPSSTSSSGTGRTTHDYIGIPEDLGKKPARVEKDDLAIRREKVAHAKLQKLMGKTFGVCSHSAVAPLTPTSPSCSSYSSSSSSPYPASPTSDDDGGLAARQLKIRDYKERKRQAKIEAFKNGGTKPYRPAPTRLIMQPKKERLATTNRIKKQPTAEEDYETIDDYKCQYDIDREKEAQNRALALLKELGF